MTKEEILGKIKKLEKELREVKGAPCEVFSRSVGYLRPVSQWNKGKQEEFKERKTFKA
jgi:ribonucleoside-triphosphate reductase